MRPHQYKELMQQLDNALLNGYEDEMLIMMPIQILDEIIDQTGTRSFEDVPEEELLRAILQWQERLEDE